MIRTRVGPRWSKLLVGSGLLVVILASGIVLSPAWSAPWSVKLNRMLESSMLALFVWIAVLIADRAMDRGAPRLPTYALAVAMGSIVGAVLSWQFRMALGRTPPVPKGLVLWTHHAFAHQIDLAVIGMLIGGMAACVHVNRRTALSARRRQHAAEQARALAERVTLESELQALQARV